MILNSDNDEARQLVDTCYLKRKTVLNPIIDWEDEDVWEFIREYKVPYCKLYDEGFKRLGCIGCPMGGARSQEREFARWPKYEQAYLKAFDNLLAERDRKGLKTEFKDAQAVMDWWLGRKTDKPLEGQIEMEL